MNSAQRATGLNGLRGFSASSVVLLHVWMVSGAHQPGQPQRVDDIVGSMGLAVCATCPRAPRASRDPERLAALVVRVPESRPPIPEPIR